MSAIYSSAAQLQKIENVLAKYMRLPFSTKTIPGAIMEGVLSHVRGARRLDTYDFVDVVDDERHLGWQVKSTMAQTPVTWKRAKIPNAEALIQASLASEPGAQKLGNAIIDFCNEHAARSLERYDLREIGYSRLVVKANGEVLYFERLLCSAKHPRLFDPSEFTWKWSKQKATTKKEQLRALHGLHNDSKRKWWAAHLLGENQLHFSGEGTWWPSKGGAHSVVFKLPSETERLPVEAFLKLLEKV